MTDRTVYRCARCGFVMQPDEVDRMREEDK